MVREILSDNDFLPALDSAGNLLAVVDYFATWCPPCKNIAPIYEGLSLKYPAVVFLKVDVDKCQLTAASQGVSAMPTFMFYINKIKVHTLKGADPKALEDAIKQFANSSRAAANSNLVPGQVDLTSFVTGSQCECLNEKDSGSLEKTLKAEGEIESDCDEQLILSIPFNQPVKLHSILVKGSKTHGPKKIKLFTNFPNCLDFDKAESAEATQELDLTEQQVENGEPIGLRFVKFQNVQNLQIFVINNQGGDDVTQISSLGFFGTPINATNMNDFQKAAQAHH